MSVTGYIVISTPLKTQLKFAIMHSIYIAIKLLINNNIFITTVQICT